MENDLQKPAASAWKEPEPLKFLIESAKAYKIKKTPAQVRRSLTAVQSVRSQRSYKPTSQERWNLWLCKLKPFHLTECVWMHVGLKYEVFSLWWMCALLKLKATTNLSLFSWICGSCTCCAHDCQKLSWDRKKVGSRAGIVFLFLFFLSGLFEVEDSTSAACWSLSWACGTVLPDQ